MYGTDKIEFVHLQGQQKVDLRAHKPCCKPHLVHSASPVKTKQLLPLGVVDDGDDDACGVEEGERGGMNGWMDGGREEYRH